MHRELLELRSAKKHTFTPWSFTTAYFAVSGGLAVDCSTFYDLDTLVFTPAGLVELARAGVLPDISDKQIKSMSKQDNIQKLIVCLQLLWFFIGVFARVYEHLPLTLIELYTVAHTTSALALYVIWYHKPYGVSAPHLCTDQRVVNLAALFALGRRAFIYQEEFVPNRTVQKDIISMPTIEYCTENPAKRREHFLRVQAALDYLKSHASHLSWRDDDDDADSPYYGSDISFGSKLVCSAEPDHSVYGALYEPTNPLAPFRPQLRARRRVLGLAYCVLCLLYAGVYLIAWDWRFPTEAERWMWRVASLSALLPMPLAVFMFFVWRPSGGGGEARTAGGSESESVGDGETGRHSGRRRAASVRRRTGRGALAVVRMLCIMCFSTGKLAYMFARVYFPVECFLSFRAVAPEVYESVKWPDVIPHFG